MNEHHALARFLRFAWRCSMAGAFAALAVWGAVWLASGRLPAPIVTQSVTDFTAVLTPETWREWMRAAPLKESPDAN